ncbi:HAD family hydrolase [Streptomyces griseosporeus]|uniref:HAD family hydrolase n=1 Tax=Streptomyces griseosporeus TaxID=1910 RepID=UPI00369A028F
MRTDGLRRLDLRLRRHPGRHRRPQRPRRARGTDRTRTPRHPPGLAATAPLADLTALRGWLRTDLGVRLGCTDADVVRSARTYWLANAHRAVPIPRMVALARTAACEGPVAVASANDGAIVRAGLAAAGLSEGVAVVVAREDVARLKAPDAFETAARQLGMPAARCLVYENTNEGVAAARAAGMHVVDVRHPARTLHPGNPQERP